MPQMNKGGKFIFGESVIRPDGRVRLPTQAVDEYHIASEGKVYLFTGSKITGGFCVTRKGLVQPSRLGHMPAFLKRNPGMGAALDPQQRHRIHKGSERAASGKSGALFVKTGLRRQNFPFSGKNPPGKPLYFLW